MPNYSMHGNAPRGGVHPSRASTAAPLPSNDGRWPWSRPELRSLAASPNGHPHPKTRPRPPRRSQSETGYPWGRNGPDLPNLSGGSSGTYAVKSPSGDIPGPWYDLERGGGKYRSFGHQIEFMPERYSMLRKESEMRFRGEGGKAYGLYMSTDKDLGPGQHVQHTTWLDPNIEKREEPKGFCQGTSVVSAPWARDGQLRIPEDKNSWIILHGLGEPENELMEADKRLQQWKANGQRKGQLILKAPRPMAPWLKPACRY